MGLIVAFLSLTNIALGYGLAVYLRRASVVAVPSETVDLMRRDAAVPCVQEQAITKTSPAPAIAPQPVAPASGEALRPEAIPEETSEVGRANEVVEESSAEVDEDDVLAGVEAFRKQLAEMDKQSDLAAIEAVDELQPT